MEEIIVGGTGPNNLITKNPLFKDAKKVGSWLSWRCVFIAIKAKVPVVTGETMDSRRRRKEIKISPSASPNFLLMKICQTISQAPVYVLFPLPILTNGFEQAIKRPSANSPSAAANTIRRSGKHFGCQSVRIFPADPPLRIQLKVMTLPKSQREIFPTAS